MSVKTAPPSDSATSGRADLARLGAPPLPQVNLLPPEVRASRQLGRTKAWLGVGILLVVLLIGGGYVLAALARADAAADLADAEAESQRLLSEQAQYAEVPRIRAEIGRAEQARLVATSTEVFWTDYVRAIQAVLPADVRITELVTEMPEPGTEGMPSGSPLDMANIGTVSFMAESQTLPDMAAWMDGLDSIPGFGSATYSTATLIDRDGLVVYEIAVEVRVDERVFAGRFLEAPDEAGDGQSDENEAGDE
jgi:hypothetical protein